MEAIRYLSGGKEATLYPASAPGGPLVVVNNYSGDGGSVVDALRGMDCPDANLLFIGGLDWDHDMTPWHCPPLTSDDRPCTGGADEYLGLLRGTILPEAMEAVDGTPAFLAIAGYSLAGLFALYAMHRCRSFERVASMSGSLWFPGFREFVQCNPPKRMPDRMYLSLGSAEAKTPNRYLRTVRDNTEFIVGHYRGLGIDATYELNPGNHFKDAAIRSAKGIRAIL